MTSALSEFYSRFVGEGDLCFDIGAHIGDKAAALAEIGARVVCVEPQSSCVSRLRERFSAGAQVEVVHAAAGEKPGDEVVLKICTAAPMISTTTDKWMDGRFSDYTWDASETVGVITLDELIERYGKPRYCKIDVEGYELSVLKGLHVPVDYLSFEFTEEFFADALSCLERLQEIGMMKFNYTLAEETQFASAAWIRGDELRDALGGAFGDLCWGDIFSADANELDVAGS